MEGLCGHEPYLSCHLDSFLLLSKWYRRGVSQFFPKGSENKYFRLCDHLVSVATAQLLLYMAVDNMHVNEWGCVSIKLSLQKEAGLGPWAIVCGSLT